MLLCRLRQDYDKKEKDLRDDHEEELKHVQLQAEDELQEKTRILKEEYDLELKVLKCQHEDECRKLQEELGHQISKEERQRALLQMQWKALDVNPKEDQEVTSNKVIRREYEVETTNGSITKRKTETTDPTKHNRVATPTSRGIKDAVKVNEGLEEWRLPLEQ